VSFADNDRLVNDFIRRRTQRPKPKPSNLELPVFEPSAVSESARDLSREIEDRLSKVLGQWDRLTQSPPDAFQLCEAVYLFDALRPPLLLALGKLRAIDPDRYSEFEGWAWIYLKPFTERSEPLTADREGQSFIDATYRRSWVNHTPSKKTKSTPRLFGDGLSGLTGY
jgi:hypothetical protein